MKPQLNRQIITTRVKGEGAPHFLYQMRQPHLAVKVSK